MSDMGCVTRVPFDKREAVKVPILFRYSFLIISIFKRFCQGFLIVSVQVTPCHISYTHISTHF